MGGVAMEYEAMRCKAIRYVTLRLTEPACVVSAEAAPWIRAEHWQS